MFTKHFIDHVYDGTDEVTAFLDELVSDGATIIAVNCIARYEWAIVYSRTFAMGYIPEGLDVGATLCTVN